MILTLDHNCIIALENGEEPDATALREVATLCQQLHHTVAVYSYLPLENRPRNGLSHDFADFPKRMEALGIGPIDTLGPAGDTSLLWWIQCVLFPTIPFSFDTYLAAKCKAESKPLEVVLEANRDHYPPPIPWTPDEVVPPPPDTLDAETKAKYRTFWEGCRKTWNNKKSDVLALGAHIWSARDGIFVTGNKHDFQHKIERLREHVPMLRILTPVEALAEVERLAIPTSPTE